MRAERFLFFAIEDIRREAQGASSARDGRVATFVRELLRETSGRR